MSESERFRSFQGSLSIPAPTLPTAAPATPGTSPAFQSQTGGGVRIPGEYEIRPLTTEQERITAMNKLGEALRASVPAGRLHDFTLAITIIATESAGDSSIESKKALRSLIANLYGFSERIR